MKPSNNDEVLATVQAARGRRYLGVTSLLLLGLLLLYVAVARPPAMGWQIFLMAMGGLSIWVAQRMWQATGQVLELTAEVLRDSSGLEIARVADIEGVDRGFLAFKPSNGFLLKTRTPGSRVWRPGLWWRIGRRVGVGGMTPASQTKLMSEIIAVTLAQRDQ